MTARCTGCDRYKAHIVRLLDAIETMREGSVREADGYLTTDPDSADVLAEAELEVRTELRMRRPTSWPGMPEDYANIVDEDV